MLRSQQRLHVRVCRMFASPPAPGRHAVSLVKET
uniref:Uncharacterized protein n=1 Tax=Anopheles atroparvus TaxID=41427 RepID=A0AAG5CPP2_ANOAO